MVGTTSLFLFLFSVVDTLDAHGAKGNAGVPLAPTSST